MKKLIIILVTIMITSFLYTSTTINGGDIEGIWTANNSPYFVNDNITIPVDASLIIEPGVQVYFDRRVKFFIDGLLIAQGTAENMINFTTENNNIE